jgi:hypothetical protein
VNGHQAFPSAVLARLLSNHSEHHRPGPGGLGESGIHPGFALRHSRAQEYLLESVSGPVRTFVPFGTLAHNRLYPGES